MKIADISVRVFRHISRQVRDSDGHSHPGDPHEARQALLTITADDGTEGIASSTSQVRGHVRPCEPDQWLRPSCAGGPRPVRPGAPLAGARSHWQRGRHRASLVTVDARHCRDGAVAGPGRPQAQDCRVYKLASAPIATRCRPSGSTHVRRRNERWPRHARGLCTLRRMAARPRLQGGRQAAHLDEAGVAIRARSPDGRKSLRRGARGGPDPDIPLMLDAYHGYSRSDAALWLGRELQRLGYYLA